MLELVANTANDAELTKVIGPYGALVLALAVIAWLVKDRARVIADRDAERAHRQQQADRMLAQAERLIPVLEHATQVIEATGEELRRARDAR